MLCPEFFHRPAGKALFSNGGSSQNEPVYADFKVFFYGFKASYSSAQLGKKSRLRRYLPYGLKVRSEAGFCTFQIYHVEKACAFSLELRRKLRRIVAVDGHFVVVAFEKPYGLTFKYVYCRKYVHLPASSPGFSSQKALSMESPTLPLFSG